MPVTRWGHACIEAVGLASGARVESVDTLMRLLAQHES